MRTLLWSIIAALAAFAVPLTHLSEPIGRDWSYFNPQVLFVRSLVWHYRTASFHNPYLCGGLDLMANPQTRVFSPFGLLDVMPIPPYLANLLPMIACAALGLAAAVRVLEILGASRLVACVGAFLLIDSSWYALHLAEGHVPFAAMQLLPCFVLCGLRYKDAGFRWALAALYVFCLFDGAVYAAIFGTYALLTLWLVGGRPAFWRELPRKEIALLVLAIIGAAAAKAIPGLASGMRPNPQRDFVRVWPPLLARALFSPWQFSEEDVPVTGSYGFHEVGCYLGVPLVALVAYGWRRVPRAVLVATLLWLWTGTGLGNDFNPWAIHRVLPFVNVAHVQSRALLFVLALLLVAAVFVLRSLPRRAQIALCLVLVVESIAVRTYTWASTVAASPEAPLTALVTNETISHIEDHGEMRPNTVYERKDFASRDCYEPAFPKKLRIAAAEGDPSFRGMVWLDAGAAALDRYTPGHIELRYDAPSPPLVHVNTNTLAGWRVVSGEGTVTSRAGELLSVQAASARGALVLEYRPAYRALQLGAALLAYALLAFTWLRSRSRER